MNIFSYYAKFNWPAALNSLLVTCSHQGILWLMGPSKVGSSSCKWTSIHFHKSLSVSHTGGTLWIKGKLGRLWRYKNGQHTDRQLASASTASNQSRTTFRSWSSRDTIPSMKIGKKGDWEVKVGPLQGIRSMHRSRVSSGCFILTWLLGLLFFVNNNQICNPSDVSWFT